MSTTILVAVTDIFFYTKVRDALRPQGYTLERIRSQDEVAEKTASASPAALILNMNDLAIDAFKAITRYLYDQLGSLVGETDPRGQRRTLTYGADFRGGAIYVATHKKNISQMSGLGRTMPWTFGAFAVAALSMIGAPPVAGFISKLYLLIGALDAGAIGILVVLVASTLLNAAYFVPVIYQGFFGRPSAEDAAHPAHEAPLSMVIPLCLSAAISVILGLYPDFFMQFAQAVVK